MLGIIGVLCTEKRLTDNLYWQKQCTFLLHLHARLTVHRRNAQVSGEEFAVWRQFCTLTKYSVRMWTFMLCTSVVQYCRLILPWHLLACQNPCSSSMTSDITTQACHTLTTG